MRVKLLYFAQLREAANAEEQTLVLERSMTVGDLAREVMSRPEFEKFQGLRLRYALNDEFVGPEQWVEDGGVLAMLPPVAGG